MVTLQYATPAAGLWLGYEKWIGVWRMTYPPVLKERETVMVCFCISLLADGCKLLQPWRPHRLQKRCLSRALTEQGALFRSPPICVILHRWQTSVFGASCEYIRAMHMAGPAPSGDFWFLLVASKGTRRRQGIWGDVDFDLVFRF